MTHDDAPEPTTPARVPGPAARPDEPVVPAPVPGDEWYDAEGQPLDPRAIARASLAADRNWSLWVILGAVVLSGSVALVAGTPTGALVLAVFLACCAVVRGVVRGGPAALVVRRRAVDVAVLAGLALAIAVLSQIVPAPPS